MPDALKTDFYPPIDSLIVKLKRLDEGLQTKGMRTALVASIAPLKKGIKGRIHDVTGALRASIGHKSLSTSAKRRLGHDSKEVVVVVGATRKTAGAVGSKGKKWDQNYKLNWLERGTSPHDIPKQGHAWQMKTLKFGHVYRKTVSHPGAVRTDLIWKSLQASRMQQQSLFDKKLKIFLDKNTGN